MDTTIFSDKVRDGYHSDNDSGYLGSGTRSPTFSESETSHRSTPSLLSASEEADTNEDWLMDVIGESNVGSFESAYNSLTTAAAQSRSKRVTQPLLNGNDNLNNALTNISLIMGNRLPEAYFSGSGTIDCLIKECNDLENMLWMNVFSVINDEIRFKQSPQFQQLMHLMPLPTPTPPQPRPFPQRQKQFNAAVPSESRFSSRAYFQTHIPL